VNRTAELARFAATLEAKTLPPAVVADVKRLLLDAVASALVGWTSPQSHQLDGTARALFGNGDVTVFAGTPMSAAGAALVNGYLTTARSFCDVHRQTLCHVTPVVVPAALAAAEEARASGPDLIAGLAAGMEALLRIGTALDYPEFRRRGWHTPGVAGPLGAALAAARVAGLDADRTTHAMGLAGSQAGGTFASFGSPAIKFHQARAAMAGLISARLAAAGFEGSPDILTADDGGLLGTFSNGGDPGALTDGLGSGWHIGEIATRRWPAAAALQPVIESILDADLEPDDVVAVTVGLPPDGFRMHAGVGWESPFTATLSARWVTAVSVHDREAWLPQFGADRISDERTGELANRVTVTEEPGLGDGEAAVAVTTTSGEHRLNPVIPNPDWEATVAKARRAADGVLPPGSVDTLVESIGSLEGVDDVSELLAPLRP
jgi:2-methylcitrate dehydratase PrpD